MKTKTRSLKFFLLLSVIFLFGCVSQKSGIKTSETEVNKKKEEIRLTELYDVGRYNLKNEIGGHRAFLSEMTKKKGLLLFERAGLEKSIQEKEAQIETDKQSISGIRSRLSRINIACGVVDEKIASLEKKLSSLEKDSAKLSTKPAFLGGAIVDFSKQEYFQKTSWEDTLKKDQSYLENEFRHEREILPKEVVKNRKDVGKQLVTNTEVATVNDENISSIVTIDILPENIDNKTKEVVTVLSDKPKAKAKAKTKGYTLAILDGWRNHNKATVVGNYLKDNGIEVKRIGVTKRQYTELKNKVYMYCKDPRNKREIELMRKVFRKYEVVVKKAFNNQKEDAVVVIGKNVF